MNRRAPPLLLATAALGAASIVTQLVLLRELLGAFAGNELVLGLILGSWLLLTGLGAALGRAAERLRDPLGVLLGLLVVLAVLPVGLVWLVRAGRDAVFLRGTAIGVMPTALASVAVLLPFCVGSGYLLAVASAALAQRDGPAGIGRVYIADTLGGVAGGVAFSFVLLPRFDHFIILGFSALATLGAVGLAAWWRGRRKLLALVVVVTAGLVALLALVDLDALATRWQYPAQEVLFRGESPYGRLVVTRWAGQITFLQNGQPVLASQNLEQVEETVHYAMIQRPEASEVLLIGGGIAGTAREILHYRAAWVTYVELDPLVLAAGERFLPERLADWHLTVVNADARRFLRDTPQRFGVILLDTPEPATAQLNRLYTAEACAQAKQALAPGGVLALTLGRYENFIGAELAQMLASMHRTLAGTFRNVRMLPGSRVCFLASDGPLYDDIATRLEARHIPTRWVTRSYLDATLTPDRYADLARAAGRPAEVNRDLRPVLCYYHLRYWSSQFQGRGGWLAAALGLALVLYLARAGAAPLALAAGGFAASALELVLLLAFQALCGALYRQLGVIVTVFMAGLALGAMMANRRRGDPRLAAAGDGGGGGSTPIADCGLRIAGVGEEPGAAVSDFSNPQSAVHNPHLRLAALVWALAGYAAILPMVLVALGRLEGAAASPVVPVAIGGMTLVLALLVGAAFPLASRADAAAHPQAGPGGAARLYAADLIGACLGAGLTSALIVPVLGVPAACGITAGLNVIAGVVVWGRR